MKYLTQIDVLQVEISNFCNADCQGCVRIAPNAKFLFKQEGTKFLPTEVFKNIFDTDIGRQIKEIEFCGTVDEPLAHKYFLDILDTIYTYNPQCTVSIHTNGSLRSNKFYIELAEKLRRHPQHMVRFSIDGMQENHYLYRGVENWNDIIRHAEIFIQAGGSALWQMLEFPWNKKDVKRCKKIAKKIGMKRFVLRRDRSKYSQNGKASAVLFRNRIKTIPDRFSKRLDISSVDKMVASFGDNLSIDCHFRQEKKMFLDYNGAIWPCCFVANPLARGYTQHREMYNKTFSKYGENFNSLYRYNLDEILAGEYYSNDLVSSWSEKYSFEHGCLSTCIKQCSKESLPIGKHIGMQEL